MPTALSSAFPREPLAWLAAIVASSQDAIYGKTLDGTIISWNQAASRLYGYAAEEAIGQPISLIIPSERLDELDGIMARLRAGERIEHHETIRRHKDGHRVAVSVTISPILASTGIIVGASAIARDITARKADEAALREQAALLDLAHDAIFVRTLDGAITYWNAAATELYGYTREEALGSISHELLKTVFPPRVTSIDDLLKHVPQWEGELVHTRRDGTPVAVDSRQGLVRDKSGRPLGILETNRDITARKRAEARASGLQAVTAALARAATVEDVSSAVLQGGAEALGANLGVFALVNDDRETLNLQDTLGYGTDKTGGASFAAMPLSARLPLTDAVRMGKPVWLHSNPERRTAYPELADMQTDNQAWAAVPLDNGHHAIGAIGWGFAAPQSFPDEEQSFLLAMAQLCAQALERARLLDHERAAHAALEQELQMREAFLWSIAHDLRTPLTAIRGMVQLSTRQAARLDTPETARMVIQLTKADAAVARMNAMLEGVLDLTRMSSGRAIELNRRSLDLVALVRQLMEDQRPSAPLHRLLLTTPPAEIIGSWDAVRLERVLGNLLSNAIKYSPEGGDIFVGVRAELHGCRPWAVVTIQDHGIGIPAADLPHLFDGFHRGSNVSVRVPGIGMGLAGAKQIVDQHGGELSLESAEGQGTTATLRLPCEPPEKPAATA